MPTVDNRIHISRQSRLNEQFITQLVSTYTSRPSTELERCVNIFHINPYLVSIVTVHR